MVFILTLPPQPLPNLGGTPPQPLAFTASQSWESSGPKKALSVNMPRRHAAQHSSVTITRNTSSNTSFMSVTVDDPCAYLQSFNGNIAAAVASLLAGETVSPLLVSEVAWHFRYVFDVRRAPARVDPILRYTILRLQALSTICWGGGSYM